MTTKKLCRACAVVLDETQRGKLRLPAVGEADFFDSTGHKRLHQELLSCG